MKTQPKTYVLLKDLPDSNAGDEYVWNDSQKAYYKDGNVISSYWTAESVENNPDWFKLKQEPVIDKENEWVETNGTFHVSAPFDTDGLTIETKIEGNKLYYRYVKLDKPILFKTEDGFDIFVEHDYYIVFEDDNSGWKPFEVVTQLDNNIKHEWFKHKKFKHKQNAVQYIIDNKPMFSIADFKKVSGDNRCDYYMTMGALKDLAKQKCGYGNE